VVSRHRPAPDGRATYQEMAEFWPASNDAYAAPMTTSPRSSSPRHSTGPTGRVADRARQPGRRDHRPEARAWQGHDRVGRRGLRAIAQQARPATNTASSFNGGARGGLPLVQGPRLTTDSNSLTPRLQHRRNAQHLPPGVLTPMDHAGHTRTGNHGGCQGCRALIPKFA